MVALLAEFTGDDIAIIPTTSYSAPAEMFPTEARNDSSAYSVDSATSTFTLPSSGLANGYLLEAGFEFEDTSNGRHNVVGQFSLTSGTGDFVSARASGYNRDNSEDRAFVRVWCFIHNPSAGAEIQFQWKRDTDTPTGRVVRAQAQITPFHYANIGMYSSVSTAIPGSTTPTDVVGWSATTESDTAQIQLDSNTVLLKGVNKKYMLLGGQAWDNVHTTRTQRWHGFEIDGSFDDSSKGYSYCRNNSNNNIGEMFSTLYETGEDEVEVKQSCFCGYQVTPFPADGADVTVAVTGSDPLHAMLVLELHDETEVFKGRSNSQQSLSSAGTRVDMDIVNAVDIMDAASFTAASSNQVRTNKAGNYLLGANVAGGYTTSSAARATAYSLFKINSTEQTYSVAGDYGRGNQSTTDTYGWGSNNIGFLSTALNDTIGVTAGKINGGEGGTIAAFNGWSSFWGINIDTLEPAGAPADPAIYVGADDIDNVYIGPQDFRVVYLGST